MSIAAFQRFLDSGVPRDHVIRVIERHIANLRDLPADTEGKDETIKNVKVFLKYVRNNYVRQPGFYWVRNGDEIEPAQYDGENWWLLGCDFSMSDDRVEVVGVPIQVPEV